jgi:hypothetical protein
LVLEEDQIKNISTQKTDDPKKIYGYKHGPSSQRRGIKAAVTILPGLPRMLVPTFLFSVGQACEGLHMVDCAEIYLQGRQFKEEGTKSLDYRTVTGNVLIPIARVCNRGRRIRYGSPQSATFSAKTAPLIREKFLFSIAVQIYTGYIPVSEIPVDIFSNPEKCLTQEGQVPARTHRAFHFTM